ncbi:MAG TPA: histidinol-phosphate transaminase [Nitrospiraceae bacterium]|nr:histidinol-phosphate transaminase [Nitrospiraceae bacterium]
MKENDIKNLVRPVVRSLRPYDAKEIPCKIKLDANESPFGFKGDIFRALKFLKTNRYPDPEAKELKIAIGRRYGISSENILVGNGSDELIYYIITTFGGPVLHPIPTFSMYGIIAQALGEKVIAIPLDRGFDIDLEKTLNAVEKEKPRLIFLSSPNNPTGNCFSAERIMKIIDASKGIVVVDEAYQPFSSEQGFLPLLRNYRNLVIMRTLSKIGLAALRVGFVIADAAIINEVNKVRLPFNVNSLSQAIAVAALKEKKQLSVFIKTIISERERLFSEMAEMNSITPYPSEANFILFKIKNPDDMYQALLRRDVLVRNLNDGIKGCLRVTVGTRQENSVFLKALRELS